MFLVNVAEDEGIFDVPFGMRVIKLEPDYSIVLQAQLKITRVLILELLFKDIVFVSGIDYRESHRLCSYITIIIFSDLSMNLTLTHLIVFMHNYLESYHWACTLLLHPFDPHMIYPFNASWVFPLNINLVPD